MTVRKPFLPNSQAFLSAMKVLVTGAAGFIGMYVAQRLAQRGDTVVGIDNMNDYYAVRLKQDRLKVLEASAGFSFVYRDIADADALSRLFAGEKFPSGERSPSGATIQIPPSSRMFANTSNCCSMRLRHRVLISRDSPFFKMPESERPS